MDKKNFYYYDLPFWQDLTSMGEALQYSCNIEPKTPREIEQKQFWRGELVSRINPDVCKQIKAFKKSNAKFLAESPILAAVLDTYLAVAETQDPNKLKDIYVALQNIQKDLPFETNKTAYVDAGCSFTKGFGAGDSLSVLFPITLYGGYDPEKVRDDDHRGGYLYPVHVLNNEDIKELYEQRPILAKKLVGFAAAYDKVTSQPNGPTGN